MTNNSLISGISSFLAEFAKPFRESRDIVYKTEELKILAEEYEGHLSTHGFRLIGFGAFRAVFEWEGLPGVVFKIPFFKSGRDSIWEHAFWKTASETERSFLAEVYHIHEGVCVMQKIQGTPLAEKEVDGPRVEYYYSDYVDTHTENYIVEDSTGRIVLVDYGR